MQFFLIAITSLFFPLSFYAENIALGVRFDVVAIFALIGLVAAAVIYFIARSIVPNRHSYRVTGVFFAAILLIYIFDAWTIFVRSQFPSLSVAISFIVLFVLALLAAALLVRGRVIVRFLVIAMIASSAIPVINIANHFWQIPGATPSASQSSAIPAKGNTSASAETLPSVYYIIVDGYERLDVLKAVTGHDATKFVDDLEQRGFRVATDSRSNFMGTDLSVAGLFMQKYPFQQTGGQISTINEAISVALGNNPTVRYFRDKQYSYVMAESRWCSLVEDRCLVPQKYVPREVWRLLNLTPIPVVLSYVAPTAIDWLASARYVTIPFLTESIASISQESVFLVAHTNVLHDMIYTQSCELRKDVIDRDRDMLKNEMRALQKIEPYTDSLTCVNNQLLDLTDEIVRRAPSAIIILTSDHGWSFLYDKSLSDDEQTPAFYAERTANFFAARFPSRCTEYFRDDITPVNHFRFVESCIDGRARDYLPNRFFSGFKLDSNTTIPEISRDLIHQGQAQIFQKNETSGQ